MKKILLAIGMMAIIVTPIAADTTNGDCVDFVHGEGVFGCDN